MLKRFLKAERQFRTVHSAYRNVDFRLVDSKPTDLANQKREIDLISKIKRRSNEIEEVERIKNELRPRAEAIFRLHDEVLPLTEDDFDEGRKTRRLMRTVVKEIERLVVKVSSIETEESPDGVIDAGIKNLKFCL